MTPSFVCFQDSFEENLEQLFSGDKFCTDSRIDAKELDKILTVDEKLFDLDISKEYLDKILDVQFLMMKRK